MDPSLSSCSQPSRGGRPPPSPHQASEARRRVNGQWGATSLVGPAGVLRRGLVSTHPRVASFGCGCSAEEKRGHLARVWGQSHKWPQESPTSELCPCTECRPWWGSGGGEPSRPDLPTQPELYTFLTPATMAIPKELHPTAMLPTEWLCLLGQRDSHAWGNPAASCSTPGWAPERSFTDRRQARGPYTRGPLSTVSRAWHIKRGMPTVAHCIATVRRMATWQILNVKQRK